MADLWQAGSKDALSHLMNRIKEFTGLKKTAFNQTTVYFLVKISVLDDKLK